MFSTHNFHTQDFHQKKVRVHSVVMDPDDYEGIKNFILSGYVKFPENVGTNNKKRSFRRMAKTFCMEGMRGDRKGYAVPALDLGDRKGPEQVGFRSEQGLVPQDREVTTVLSVTLED